MQAERIRRTHESVQDVPPPNAARSRVQTWRNLPCDAAQPRLPAIDRAKHGHATSARGDDCVSHAIAPMHVYAHVDTQSRRKLTRKEAQCMNRSHSMPAWPGGGTTATTRSARQASAAASTRRRHAARLRRRQAACRRQRAMTSPACASPTAQSDANTRTAFSTATRMRTGTDESKRASSVRASVRECRRRARRTGPRPRQSAGVGRSCASLAASSPSPSLSSSASRRAGSPLVSRSVRARSASSR